MSKNRLFILGSTGIPARYGGFETYAENIAENLSAFEVHVACEKSLYTRQERNATCRAIKRFYIAFKANGIQSVAYDLISLLKAIKRSEPNDNFLLLGVSFGLFIPIIRSCKKRQLIVHIDGIEWERKKWNHLARLVLKTAYTLSLQYANKILIDNKALSKKIPLAYHDKICYTTYGFDHLPPINTNKPPIASKYALVIARAEPENNFDTILKAFTDLPDLQLVVISNAQQTKHGRYLLRKYRQHSNISFIDAIYDDIELLHAYRKNCYIYIHGHSAGGTNPSLVEAMGSMVPIIAANNRYNRTSTNNLCLYFNNSEEIIHHIKTVKANKLSAMKHGLYLFAQTEYTWTNAVNLLIPILRNN